ncbi:MAG: hypothetical protein PHE55_06190 [Methylococcaceae bacterium]|nr:hypothetical protein [Methylococcaceae bacterium]
MFTSTSKTKGLKVFFLRPTYENVHALLTELHIYVFDPEGHLIDDHAVNRGRAQIVATEEELLSASIVLAPPLQVTNCASLNLETARGHYIFETRLNFERGRAYYELPQVPESLWRWWLVQSLWKNIRETSAHKPASLTR